MGASEKRGLDRYLQRPPLRWTSQLAYSSTGSSAFKEPMAVEYPVLLGPWACLGSYLQKGPKYRWGWTPRQSVCLSPPPPAPSIPASLTQCPSQCPGTLQGGKVSAHTISCLGGSLRGEAGALPRHRRVGAGTQVFCLPILYSPGRKPMTDPLLEGAAFLFRGAVRVRKAPIVSRGRLPSYSLNNPGHSETGTRTRQPLGQ